MKFTHDDIRNLIPSMQKRNPELFGGVRPVASGVPEQGAAPALVEKPRQRKGRKRVAAVVVVQLIARVNGVRFQDDDNLAGAFKPMRDAIARWLGVDDGDPAIRWEYGQIQGSGPEGTLVTIDLLS